MSFKPIYWYYGNTKFSSEEIDEFKSNIDKITQTKDNNCNNDDNNDNRK